VSLRRTMLHIHAGDGSLTTGSESCSTPQAELGCTRHRHTPLKSDDPSLCAVRPKVLRVRDP
jgi:hypothetical protein